MPPLAQGFHRVNGETGTLIIRRNVKRSKSKQIIDYINRKQILIDVSEEEKTFHKNMLNKILKQSGTHNTTFIHYL